MNATWTECLKWARHTARAMKRLVLQPTIRARVCNICGYKGRFYPVGIPPRLDAGCPRCKSFERHRIFKLWVAENESHLQGKAVLHFAPERAVTSFVQPLAAKYLTADIEEGRADQQINIEAIDMADSSFDVLICSHVLEHVDDRVALAEMRRILRPDGMLLMMTPVIWSLPETYEDPTITSAQDRLLHFGQDDHVRYFGADIQ